MGSNSVIRCQCCGSQYFSSDRIRSKSEKRKQPTLDDFEKASMVNPVTPDDVERMLNVGWGDLTLTPINAAPTLKGFPTITIISLVFPKPGDQTMKFGTFTSDGLYTDLEWKVIKNDLDVFAQECDKSISEFKLWAEIIMQWSDEDSSNTQTNKDLIFGTVAEFSVLLERLVTNMERAGQWYKYPYDGTPLPHYSAREIETRLLDSSRGMEIVDMFKDCYLTHFSEYWTHWTDFGITYFEFKEVMKRLREMSRGYNKSEPTKVDPKPKKETKPAPRPKKDVKPKKKVKDKLVKRNTLVYEVRVGDKLEGTFSAKSRAESFKRELRAKGMKARVWGVIHR